jgi:glycosyltransferase involved in cell wall biosynthesis
MRVLSLGTSERDTSWLYDFDPDLRLSVLNFRGVTLSTIGWILAVTKQTFKALAIYRRYEIVFATNIAAILPLAFVHSFLRRKKPKLVGVDVSANRIESNRAGPILVSLVKAAVRSINAIICYTSAQKNWWARNIGYTKATFIPLGWGIADVRYPHDSVLNASLNAAQIDDNGYIFSGGYTARDYQTLLRAVSELPHHVVLVVGHDPLTGKTGLENVALSKKVKVYHDIRESHFLDLMSKAEMVVLALQDKPYSAGQLALLEATAMSKPVIITKTAGTIDYVEDGKTALLVEPGNVSQLKEAILKISDNVELRRDLERNAKAKWQREFTVSTMEHNLYRIISSVLS